jgi:hypothetical protein
MLMFAQRMIISMVLPSAPKQVTERLPGRDIIRRLAIFATFLRFFSFYLFWVSFFMGQRKENCSDAHRSARSETDIRFPNRFLSFIFSFQFLFPLSIILNTARKSSLAESSNFADRAHVKEHSTRSLLSFRPHLFCLHRLSFTTLTT